MQSNQNGSGLLIGKKAILQFLNISEPLFFKFVERGMPAAVIDNRYYATKSNLMDFFNSLTYKERGQISRDAEWVSRDDATAQRKKNKTEVNPKNH